MYLFDVLMNVQPQMLQLAALFQKDPASPHWIDGESIEKSYHSECGPICLHLKCYVQRMNIYKVPDLCHYYLLPSGELTWQLKMAIYSGFSH